MRVLVDLDGVVWLGDDAIAGSAAALAVLARAGCDLWAVTNNAAPTAAQYQAKLRRMGCAGAFPAERVLTSAHAAAGLVEPGAEVLVCGAAGLREAAVAAGAVVRTEGPVRAVLVGLDPEFNYERLTAAVRAVLSGATLIAANADPTYPTLHGPAPGAGSMLAAITAATGASAVIAGKPHPPMVELVRSVVELGPDDWMVGDRRSTDGEFARSLGVRFALVDSVVTEPAERGDLEPAAVGTSLADVVPLILERT